MLQVTSGNLLEMFDFFLFGFHATNIATTFFPAQSECASLILTFQTFGAGFLMRPLDAAVLGTYVDREQFDEEAAGRPGAGKPLTAELMPKSCRLR
ncbi:hypothetical protein FHT26_004254 [Rhizobacter sp. SG703]|nr:hypothetical protein [Rhizobacter sp. SG703]